MDALRAIVSLSRSIRRTGAEIVEQPGNQMRGLFLADAANQMERLVASLNAAMQAMQRNAERDATEACRCKRLPEGEKGSSVMQIDPETPNIYTRVRQMIEAWYGGDAQDRSKTLGELAAEVVHAVTMDAEPKPEQAEARIVKIADYLMRHIYLIIELDGERHWVSAESEDEAVEEVASPSGHTVEQYRREMEPTVQLLADDFPLKVYQVIQTCRQWADQRSGVVASTCV
jgi:hypothetical protein